MVEKIATEIFATAHARSCYRIFVFSSGFEGQLFMQVRECVYVDCVSPCRRISPVTLVDSCGF